MILTKREYMIIIKKETIKKDDNKDQKRKQWKGIKRDEHIYTELYTQSEE